MNRKGENEPVNILLGTIIAIYLLSFSTLNAQETKVVRDLNLWTGVEIEKSLLDDFTISLKQEVRFKRDISELNNVFSQLGVSYNLNKNFSLSGKYRYILNRKSGGDLVNQSRYSLNLMYKGKLDYISIYYRLRYQKEVESMHLLKPNEPFEKYFRHRISVRYTDFDMIKPYISAEIFQLNTMVDFPMYNQLRLLGGVKISPKKIGSFNLSWGLERELNNILPYTYYITKLNYTYKF